MEPSDERLILACRRGEEEAWRMLIERYQRLIYAIPRRAGLGEELAAEVFQQVFAILVENLDHLTQPAQIQAWLVTTAKRETWHVLRRERRGHSSAGADDKLADETLSLPDGAPLPDEVLLRLEEQHTVRLALGELDERCRRLLTLLFYQEEPPAYSEIAATLGIKEGSIGPTRARCLQKLLRLLNNSALGGIFTLLQATVKCAEMIDLTLSRVVAV